VNVGVRPTFDNGLPSIEAYLLDFDEDLYGQCLGLSFMRRLRGEMKFPGIPELVAQIRTDVRVARRVLGRPDHDGGASGEPAWQELPHTADWAFRVHGASQRRLFARAATALFSLEGADPDRPIEIARALHVTAEDTPDLLVAWLNRLLLGQETGGELYSRFRIYEISHRGLRGVAYGYRGAPQHTAVKAATYYDLDVTQAAGKWTATITFDV
jgi:SHS2 domain-containing protein